MEVEIRKASESDLDRILLVETQSYPRLLQATKEVLRERMNIFGIWVAEVGREIVGFFTCVPARLDLEDIDIERIIKNRKPDYQPWFEEYKRNSDCNVLLVTSTAVKKDYQNKGIGTSLVKHSLKVAREFGLHSRVSALRCEYKKYFQETEDTIDTFLLKVTNGKIKDKFLNLYLKLGFELLSSLPNYEPNEESLNYNILAIKNLTKKSRVTQ